MAYITPLFRRELPIQARIHAERDFTTMPTSTSSPASPDIESFATHLKSSSRILALCGAGLSAGSGLPTFRGAGGYWRNNEATQLATPQAFQTDPGLVWQFYSYRRHMALKAKPNNGHLALAELARRRNQFLTITQNVDGLSQRAQHPPENLEMLHGSLFNLKCTNFECDYNEPANFTDPIVSALALSPGSDDISDTQVPLKEVGARDLPHCPKCKSWLLRPGVVWFGESLPTETLTRVSDWINDPRGVDLLLVIGTSASVYPAAGYIETARAKGARVAVINMEFNTSTARGLQSCDWFFQGDASVILPDILKGIIGLPETSSQ